MGKMSISSISQSWKRIVLVAFLCFVTVMMFSSVFMVPGRAGTYGTTQITNNDYSDYDPRVKGGIVVWEWYDGSDSEISFYNISSRTTRRITDNDQADYDPQTDGKWIVWRRYDSVSSDYKIYLYEISSGNTRTMTDVARWEGDSQIDGGKVVWEGNDGVDNEIFYYDISLGGTPTNISANTRGDYDPQIDSGKVVWYGYDGSDNEIFLKDISTPGIPTNISANGYGDYDPQIDSGKVVWESYDGVDYEIFLYDITSGSKRKITDNSYSDSDPQIESGMVVWIGYPISGADPEIFLYDFSSNTTTQITNNRYLDSEPQIDSGIVVWTGYDYGANQEIFVYDSATKKTMQITNNTNVDYNPQIDSGKVVWRSYDGADYEIFLTIVDVTSPSTTISLSGTLGSNGWWTSDVKVTLAPSDTGSGVANTYYRLAEGATWTPYTASFNITNQGNNLVQCYSTDLSAPPNIETTKSQTIKIDKNPPTGSITINQGAHYTNATSATLTLSATDTTSGVAQMHFSSNASTWTAWENYAPSKSWTLPSGDGAKTVYAQFIDTAGLISPSYQGSITLDTLAPTITVSDSLKNGTEIRSSSYTLNWTATDTGSGIDHYEVRFDDNAWMNVGKNATYKFSGLGEGGHTFEIKAVDKSNKTKTQSVNLVINTSPILGPGYLEEAILGVVIGAVAVGAVVYLMRRPKKPPMPTKLRIQAEPTEIIADGKSKSTITIQLLDKKDKPIAAKADTEVKLTTTRGKLETPAVKIAKGEETAKAVLISSTEIGAATVSAEAPELKSMEMTLEFKERPRFCMGCGTRMSVTDKRCKKCGAAPEQFTGAAKICKNCERMGKTTYIPQTAEFCSECGASQPKQEG